MIVVSGKDHQAPLSLSPGAPLALGLGELGGPRPEAVLDNLRVRLKEEDTALAAFAPAEPFAEVLLAEIPHV
jgi:hypothetical protein